MRVDDATVCVRGAARSPRGTQAFKERTEGASFVLSRAELHFSKGIILVPLHFFKGIILVLLHFSKGIILVLLHFFKGKSCGVIHFFQRIGDAAYM